MTDVVNMTGGIEIGGTVLYGMDAEQALKQAAKYDYGRERLIVKWIEAVLGEKLKSKDLHEALKSGVVLCKLLNKIRPNIIKKFNTREIALMEIENIKLYLEGCWKLGVPSSCLFVSSDLYKARGMNEVLNNLEALSKIAARIPTYKGPVLEIHERERGGASSSGKSSSTASKPAKKWKTIEINAPKHIHELSSHEDVDIRSENLRLKQQLEREKYERMDLEEELEELKKAGPGKSSQSSSQVDESKWKEQVANLEGRIRQLERELSDTKKLIASPSFTSKAQDAMKQLQAVQKKLSDEELAHEATKRKYVTLFL